MTSGPSSGMLAFRSRRCFQMEIMTYIRITRYYTLLDLKAHMIAGT